ncbi:MAG: hypothetical protein AAGC95_11240 [Pseudomonadota bacterium]
MTDTSISAAPISGKFSKAASKPPRKPKKKRVSPLSIRASDEEKARLRAEAGNGSVHALLRERVFGPDAVSKRRTRRQPSIDHAALGRVLGALGQSRLSQNMNQIARAVHAGALPINDDLQKDVREACAAIQDMRRELITALGIKPE